MNAVAINTFSQAVIVGLANQGISSNGLQLLMATPKGRMSRIVAGTANLSGREIRKIESMTGLTAGQLAALAIEPNGGELTDLFKHSAVLLKLERAIEEKERAKPKRQSSKSQSRKSASRSSSRRSVSSRSKRPSHDRVLAVA